MEKETQGIQKKSTKLLNIYILKKFTKNVFNVELTQVLHDIN
jgi:hypothetical protein